MFFDNSFKFLFLFAFLFLMMGFGYAEKEFIGAKWLLSINKETKYSNFTQYPLNGISKIQDIVNIGKGETLKIDFSCNYNDGFEEVFNFMTISASENLWEDNSWVELKYSAKIKELKLVNTNSAYRFQRIMLDDSLLYNSSKIYGNTTGFTTSSTSTNNLLEFNYYLAGRIFGVLQENTFRINDNFKVSSDVITKIEAYCKQIGNVDLYKNEFSCTKYESYENLICNATDYPKEYKIDLTQQNAKILINWDHLNKLEQTIFLDFGTYKCTYFKNGIETINYYIFEKNSLKTCTLKQGNENPTTTVCTLTAKDNLGPILTNITLSELKTNPDCTIENGNNKQTLEKTDAYYWCDSLSVGLEVVYLNSANTCAYTLYAPKDPASSGPGNTQQPQGTTNQQTQPATPGFWKPFFEKFYEGLLKKKVQ